MNYSNFAALFNALSNTIQYIKRSRTTLNTLPNNQPRTRRLQSISVPLNRRLGQESTRLLKRHFQKWRDIGIQTEPIEGLVSTSKRHVIRNQTQMSHVNGNRVPELISFGPRE